MNQPEKDGVQLTEPIAAPLNLGLIQFYERNTGDVVKAQPWAQLTPKEREKWVLKYDEYIKEVNKENESGPGLCVHSAIEYAKSIDTETGNELLAKRNQELKAENAYLKNVIETNQRAAGIEMATQKQLKIENAQLKEQLSLVMVVSGKTKEENEKLKADLEFEKMESYGYDALKKEYREMELRVVYHKTGYKKLEEQMDHCIDIAWGIIANAIDVYGLDDPKWCEAAVKWRDTYLPETSRRNAERVKYSVDHTVDFTMKHESGYQPNNDLEVQWYNRIAGWLEQGATISATNKTLPVMKGEEGNLTIIFPGHESGDLAQDPQLTDKDLNALPYSFPYKEVYPQRTEDKISKDYPWVTIAEVKEFHNKTLGLSNDTRWNSLRVLERNAWTKYYLEMKGREIDITQIAGEIIPCLCKGTGNEYSLNCEKRDYLAGSNDPHWNGQLTAPITHRIVIDININQPKP